MSSQLKLTVDLAPVARSSDSGSRSADRALPLAGDLLVSWHAPVNGPVVPVLAISTVIGVGDPADRVTVPKLTEVGMIEIEMIEV